MSTMPKTNWVSTKIPRILHERIEKLVERGDYRSITNFLEVAIREKIEAIERHEIEKQKWPPFRRPPQAVPEDRSPDK